MNITVIFFICEESSATAYGVFDRDFDFDSHECSCSNPSCEIESNDLLVFFQSAL